MELEMDVEKASSCRRNVALLFGAFGIFLSQFSSPVFADSKDGIFPSADQVGGQVYVNAIRPGVRFPTDFDVFDLDGKKVDLEKLIKGKRTVLAFFISAAPVSVSELRNLQDFTAKNAPGVRVLNINADTVGVALEGGPSKALGETIKTMRVIKKEHGLVNPLYVAPNDALSPKGISNRLGARGLPTIFVVDAQGTVEKVFVGPQKWKKGDI